MESETTNGISEPQDVDDKFGGTSSKERMVRSKKTVNKILNKI